MHSARHALEAVDELRNGNIGRIVHQQLNMIPLSVHFHQFCIEVLADVLEDVFEEPKLICSKACTPVFCHEDQMHMHHEYTVSSPTDIDVLHRTSFRKPSIILA